MSRGLAVALLVCAIPLVGCGEDEGPATDTTVGEILDAPDSFDRRVAVTGVGSPVGELGFILEDDERSIFVSALRSEALKVDDGDDLQVVGEIERLDDFRAEDIGEAEGSDVAEVDTRAIEQAPVETGDPYLELVSLSGEDTPVPGEPAG